MQQIHLTIDAAESLDRKTSALMTKKLAQL